MKTPAQGANMLTETIMGLLITGGLCFREKDTESGLKDAAEFCLQALREIPTNPGRFLGENKSLELSQGRETIWKMMRECWFQGLPLSGNLTSLRCLLLDCRQYQKDRRRLKSLLQSRFILVGFFVLFFRSLILEILPPEALISGLPRLDLALSLGGALLFPLSFHLIFHFYPSHWLWTGEFSKEGQRFMRMILLLPLTNDHSETFKLWDQMRKISLLGGQDMTEEITNFHRNQILELKSRQDYLAKKWEENLPLFELMIWSVFVFCLLFHPVRLCLSFLTPVDMT